MKIMVCVKRVPATDSRIKIADDGTSLDTTSIEWIVSPYDEFALEQALQIKDADADTEVVVVSLAPAAATKELRTCLAMGADSAIHIKDEEANTRDALTTASALADAIADAGADLILCGKMAVDHDQGQVGTLLAYKLDRPCVTEVRDLTIEGNEVIAERAGGGGTKETYAVPLPAVLTVTKGDKEPRYANLKGIMKAKKKPIDERDAAAGADHMTVKTMELPPERPEGRIVGEGVDAVGEVMRLLREEAKVL